MAATSLFAIKLRDNTVDEHYLFKLKNNFQLLQIIREVKDQWTYFK